MTMSVINEEAFYSNNSCDLVTLDSPRFVDFRVKLEEAFEHNQIAETAKATKIKELLRGNVETKIKELLQGNAKYGIPITLEKIDDIYKASGRAFEDHTRLLNHKKKSLTKLGALPSWSWMQDLKVWGPVRQNRQ